MTERVIRLSPAEYINEDGILKNLDVILDNHGYHKAVVFTDRTVKDIIVDYLPDGFLHSHPVEFFNGSATEDEIYRLNFLFKSFDVLIAFGGGQLMDTAKVVADNLRIPLINVPTLPSNCAAITTKSILYSEDTHEMVGAHRQNQAVTLVLLEPEILKNAPYEYILSGIGDTLAKYYEIRLRLTQEKLGLISAAVGKQFLEICRQEMLKVTDVSSLSGQALTNFLDTIFLVAASVDGVADLDGRSVAAHAFYNAYIKFHKGTKKTHGEVVALGILFQLYLEGDQADLLNELTVYYKKVGLPLTLSDVYLDKEELESIADYIVEPEDIRVQSIFPNITKEEALSALLSLES